AHLSTQPIEPGSTAFLEYYLDCDYQVLHQLLAIPRVQTDLEALRKRMRTTKGRLAKLLGKLEDRGLVEGRGEGAKRQYRNCRSMLHLSPESPLFRHQKKAIRLAALQKLDHGIKEGLGPYSLNVLFTADKKTRDRIQDRFWRFCRKWKAWCGTRHPRNF